MPRHKDLGGLLRELQSAVAHSTLTPEVILGATENLKQLGFRDYDEDKFPALVDTEHFTDTSGGTPANLAEALLWKLGKWQVYKNFVRNYSEDRPVTNDGGVVLSAFAKHLRNRDNPIYDQHALRALWAICDFPQEDHDRCRKLLFTRKDLWKEAGSGDSDGTCYRLFARHLDALCGAGHGVTKGGVDRLLMPLGQALKQQTRTGTNDYRSFRELCGRPDVA